MYLSIFLNVIYNIMTDLRISLSFGCQLGGNSWTVLLGRRDSTTASLSTVNSDIPGPNLNLRGLISSFSKKGLTTKEMVVLSGA